MATSRIKTLLPLEEYARIMSIPGWHFNQVEHPGRPARGNCDLCWIQSGYVSDPNRIVGRDEVAQAIAEAEANMAAVAGFWPAPRWHCGDRELPIGWPQPSRGRWLAQPTLKTRWGYLIAQGVETWEKLNLYPVGITYTDTDGDGITDWATIQFGVYLDEVEDVCEVVVTPPEYDPEENWIIRPLNVSLSGGTLQISGYKWQFVLPTVWNTADCVDLDQDLAGNPDFLTGVDIYRHYTTPFPAGVIRWLPSGCETVPCVGTSQTACILILDPRLGHFTVSPGSYAAGTGLWTSNTLLNGFCPKDVQLWYYAGYRDPTCDSCDFMGPSIKRAIVSLANTYMADPPCGCDETMARWQRDNEFMPMETYNVAMAQSHFGTSARGAVYAYSVISRIPMLGQGG
jgi:hypothetical protein